MKSKDISKYDIHWQIVRVSVKGRFNDDLEKKLESVYLYYKANPNKARWERVLNWMEGLKRGLKDSSKREFLRKEIDYFTSLQPANELELTDNSIVSFKKYSNEQLVELLIDLFKTNEKWLKNGYFHKECNLFLDSLYKVIHLADIKNRYSFKALEELREKSRYINNHHKFFF